MKKVIRVTESELIKMIGKIINEQGGDPTQFTQQKPLNIGCVGLKSPETNKTIKGFNGETFQFFNNGRFADTKGQKGNYVCGSQANIINLMFDSDPKAVKYFNMSPQPVKQEIKWVKNETAPYKVGQMGENIKIMQEKLGVKPDGYFGKLTENAVIKFNPQYKRETGVDQVTFEKIMGGSGKQLQQQNIVTQKEVNAPAVDASKFGTNYGNYQSGAVNR